jgi:hypothetical protein
MSWNDNDNENDGADLGFDVDSTTPEEARSFDLLKRGDYPALITGCEPKAGKREGSRYVKMEITIVAGPGKGRKVWGNFTTHHPTSADAVRIGRGQIKAAFLAAGVTGSSPIDLVAAQQPIVVVVGVEKGNDDYPDDKNTIKGFKAMTPEQMASLEAGDEPASPPPPQQQQKTQAPAKSSRPSFLKK